MENSVKKLSRVYVDLSPAREEALYGKGPIPCDYMFVGIAPSKSRPSSRANEPFGARSHKVVEKIIELSGEKVYLTNLLREPFPSGKKPPIDLVRQEYPHLKEEIELVRPKRILALGDIPARILCPSFTSMKEDHGTLFFNPELNSHVVPTYHFSAIARHHSLSKIQIRDIERYFELPDPTPPITYDVEDIEDLEIHDFYKDVPRIYLDIEAEGLELGTKITMIGLGTDRSNIVHIIHNPSKRDLRWLITFFRRLKPIIVGHNLIFDIAQINESAKAAWLPRVLDTMVIAYCLGEGKGDWEDEKSRVTDLGKSLALKHLTTLHTNRPGSRAFGSTEDEAYLGEDVLSTKELLKVFRPRVKEEKIPILKTLHSLIPRIAMMYRKGVHIDALQTMNIRDKVQKKREDLEQELQSWGTINWNSPIQVAKLFKERAIPLRSKTKTGYSVKEAVLLTLAPIYKEAKILLEWRAIDKELAFLEKYWGILTPEHSFLHPRLIITSTSTGRPSMKGPNLQQVTRLGPLKTLYTSRWEDDGGLIGLLDLSQVELRAATWLHGDPKLAEALRTDDVHYTIASRVYGIPRETVTATQRKKSKAVTFGACLYGGTAKGIAEKSGFPQKEIQRIQDIFWKEYAVLDRGFKRSIYRDLRSQRIKGYLGRIRDIEDLIRVEGNRGASRKIVNTPIQQLASDILLKLLDITFSLLEERKLKTLPIITIHDAIMFDIYPDEVADLSGIMEQAFQILYEDSVLSSLHFWTDLPVVGELVIGQNWAACENTNENYNPKREEEFSTV